MLNNHNNSSLEKCHIDFSRVFKQLMSVIKLTTKLKPNWILFILTWTLMNGQRKKILLKFYKKNYKLPEVSSINWWEYMRSVTIVMWLGSGVKRVSVFSINQQLWEDTCPRLILILRNSKHRLNQINIIFDKVQSRK